MSQFPLTVFTGYSGTAKSQEGITPLEIFLLKIKKYKSQTERQIKKKVCFGYRKVDLEMTDNSLIRITHTGRK